MNRREPKSANKSFLLDIEGMKCGGCVRSVEKTLMEQEGVTSASVNLVSRTALINLESSEIDLSPIFRSLDKRGFSAKPRQKQGQNLINQKENKTWWLNWKNLIIALVLLVLSVLGHLVEGGKLNLPIIGSLPFHAFLATVALFFPGRSILINGAKAALALVPSMDTLVGLGVSSAYITSLIALVWPKLGLPCFFNEPVMLLGFILLGRFLEERSRFRTNEALNQLAELQPNKARLVIDNDQICEVDVTSLRPGERIQLLAGDRVPVDGKVVEGNSAIDISSITGEPLPIQATKGTEIVSGSLNLEGSLIMSVERIGSETSLARIIDLVEEAQSRKAPIQGIADKVAGYFCYGVVSLALITFIFWWKIGTNLWPEVLKASGQGLINSHHAHGLHSPLGGGAETPLGLAIQLSIAVLVVACPCALGLATPTVITVASGKAAKLGWLFRGGDVIEMAASIKHIVFDKTGTLTIGRPLVVGCKHTTNAEQLIQFAGTLEQDSRHPIAHAVLQKAQQQKIKLLDNEYTKTYPGKGLIGKINGVSDEILVGSPEWLISLEVNFNNQIEQDIETFADTGISILAVAQGKKLLGLILIDDQTRPDADLAIERLRLQGLSMSILSGDRKQTVNRLGHQLGFDQHQLGWQLLPEQKLKKLTQLKHLGHIAMVGDGINDAPALAESDLGIAIGTGTQIAQDTADLVLLGDRLEALPESLLLAKQTMNKIRQNLFWAFGYNLIALPIAAGILLPSLGVLLSPPLAALLMALSSITVICNALSLKAA